MTEQVELSALLGARVQGAPVKVPAPAPARLQLTEPAGGDFVPGESSSSVAVQEESWLITRGL